MAEAVRGSQTRYWILLIIGATITPLFLAGIVILYQFYDAHRERATTHLEELVEKHKQNIDGFLDARLTDIRMLASSFTFEQLSQEDLLQQGHAHRVRVTVKPPEPAPLLGTPTGMGFKPRQYSDLFAHLRVTFVRHGG